MGDGIDPEKVKKAMRAGSVKKAAKILGITREQLHLILWKFGIHTKYTNRDESRKGWING